MTCEIITFQQYICMYIFYTEGHFRFTFRGVTIYRNWTEVMELELKTEDQTNIDYNGYFYATLCHVCKRFGDDVPLKRCSGCKLISYCGPQHQKQHWAQHKTLCKAVRDVLKDDGWERHILTRDNWNCTKLALMNAVEKKKGSLEMYERQMFLFPKECTVCHDPNVESLVDCQNCALSFCKNHEDDNAHKDACAALELCLRINLSTLNKLPSFTRMLLQHNSNTEMSNTFQDMNDYINQFIKSYGNIEEVYSETSYDVLAANLSLYLTRPLTLFHAMKVLDYVPESKELVIHVIVGSNLEKYTLNLWEILLHLIPKTEVSLMIIMIGMGLNNESHFLSVCDNCLLQRKKILLDFHSGLYDDYVRSSSFVKPDIAVGFDEDIQVEGNANLFISEIRELSIKMLAEQNCPFLLTNHTHDELQESINKINNILNRKVDYVYFGKNPFASLRPCRPNIGRELVFYFNNFITIYRSLCS